MDLTNFGFEGQKADDIVDDDDDLDEDEVEELKSDKEVREFEVKSNGGEWGEVHKIDTKTEGISYISLTLHGKGAVSGEITYSVSISTAHENPHGFSGGSWGSGGEFSIDEPKEFFDELMGSKIDDQKQPYRKFKGSDDSDLWDIDHHQSYDEYRLVPMKNYCVVISKKLKELLKERGKFDFDKWYKKYQSIKEKGCN